MVLFLTYLVGIIVFVLVISVSDPVYLNYSVSSRIGPWTTMVSYIRILFRILFLSIIFPIILMLMTPNFICLLNHLKRMLITCISCLEDCHFIRDIRLWMKQNFLKLNDDKSEFIFVWLSSAIGQKLVFLMLKLVILLFYLPL